MRPLLHAEWTKFRTVRGWVVGVPAAAVVMVLVSLLGPAGSHLSIAGGGRPGGGTLGPSGESVQDSFYFVHRPLQGNGSITVRVGSLMGGTIRPNQGIQAGLGPWAKAGIIVVESTRQGSAYAAVMVTGGHGVRLQYDYTHDIAGSLSVVSAGSQRWLRLTRSGDTLTGYESIDGSHWVRVGSASLAGLPVAVQAGLFVTSPPAQGATSRSAARAEQSSSPWQPPSSTTLASRGSGRAARGAARTSAPLAAPAPGNPRH